jgi:hypothetical protein
MIWTASAVSIWTAWTGGNFYGHIWTASSHPQYKTLSLVFICRFDLDIIGINRRKLAATLLLYGLFFSADIFVFSVAGTT